MLNTYTNTNTYTFTQTEVVVNQYAKAIDYAGTISEEKADLLLEAIRNQQITSVGIYAYNKERERVAEVEIRVDWEKHRQIISTFGDVFDEGQAGFNYKKGEAAETKIFVRNLVKSARENGLNISMWVLPDNSITGDERENLLNRIGFNGGKPHPWGGKIAEETSREYKSIPQMSIGYKKTERI